MIEEREYSAGNSSEDLNQQRKRYEEVCKIIEESEKKTDSDKGRLSGKLPSCCIVYEFSGELRKNVYPAEE